MECYYWIRSLARSSPPVSERATSVLYMRGEPSETTISQTLATTTTPYFEAKDAIFPTVVGASVKGVVESEEGICSQKGASVLREDTTPSEPKSPHSGKTTI